MSFLIFFASSWFPASTAISYAVFIALTAGTELSIALFIEPNPSDIKKAKLLNADCIEIHTGKFCNLVNQNKNFKNELNKIKKAVTLGNKIGLEVHAGHGLTYKSAKILSKTKGIREFNIGHFLIGESIFVGFANSIKQFKKIIK